MSGHYVFSDGGYVYTSPAGSCLTFSHPVEEIRYLATRDAQTRQQIADEMSNLRNASATWTK